MLTQKIKSIDLLSVVQKEGIQIRLNGKYNTALCPFHAEKNPSFTIFPENTFHCFGCGEHGDAVDFVRRLYGLNFKDALRHLGIDNNPLTAKRMQQIRKQKQAKEQNEFIERSICFTLATTIRRYRAAMPAVEPETIDQLSFLHKLDLYEYYHNLLLFGNREQKSLVLNELRDMQLIKPDKIFRPDFDFEGWLRSFTNGANNGQTTKR
jgi:DNA primase